MREVLIRQLEYLLALSRERHFGRAAAACHISQPALSAAIRKLERELDVEIVQRGRRFEGFTDEGIRVVGWAHRILAERDALLSDLDRLRGGLTTTARIGAIPTAIPATPLLTRQLQVRHPAARIRIEGPVLARHQPPARRVRPRCRCHVPRRGDPTGHAPDRALPGALPPAGRRRESRRRGPGRALGGRGGAHTWLYAFGVPPGMCVRRLADVRPRPAVGLIVPDREPRSLVADALVESVRAVDLAAALSEQLPAGANDETGRAPSRQR